MASIPTASGNLIMIIVLGTIVAIAWAGWLIDK